MKNTYTIILFFYSFCCLMAQDITDKQIKKLLEKPENLKGKIIVKNNKQFIQLTWGDEPHEDIAELEYLLYATGFGNQLSQKASIDIRKNTYDYPAPNLYGKLYQFQIEAYYKKKYLTKRSPFSDTLSIYVPSLKLPKVNVWPVSKKEGRVTLNWKYSDRIDDLAGFRIYQDGKLIVSETEIPATVRKWTSQTLNPGLYKFQIEAITKFDVKSQLSQVKSFKIID